MPEARRHHATSGEPELLGFSHESGPGRIRTGDLHHVKVAS
jgi:hypothetical protein